MFAKSEKDLSELFSTADEAKVVAEEEAKTWAERPPGTCEAIAMQLRAFPNNIAKRLQLASGMGAFGLSTRQRAIDCEIVTGVP